MEQQSIQVYVNDWKYVIMKEGFDLIIFTFNQTIFYIHKDSTNYSYGLENWKVAKHIVLKKSSDFPFSRLVFLQF